MKYINKLQRAALKIKVKHLTQEARIIRKEEVKWRGLDKLYFKHHRKTTVRDEARATQLTIAFLRGMPYNVIEKKCYNTWKRDTVILKRMVSMASKYGNEEFRKLIPNPDIPLGTDWKERNEIIQSAKKKAVQSLISEWFNES